MAVDPKIQKSRDQENRLADLLGGSRNSGSGNGFKRKSDVRTPGFLWECKRTDAKSIRLNLVDLETNRQYAILDDRTPGFHIEIGDKRYVLLEEAEAFDRLDLYA